MLIPTDKVRGVLSPPRTFRPACGFNCRIRPTTLALESLWKSTFADALMQAPTLDMGPASFASAVTLRILTVLAVKTFNRLSSGVTEVQS